MNERFQLFLIALSLAVLFAFAFCATRARRSALMREPFDAKDDLEKRKAAMLATMTSGTSKCKPGAKSAAGGALKNLK